VIHGFLIFVAQKFGIIWAWQGINDKSRISHGPLRLEKVMKFSQWVCYENCEWHSPLVTLFGLCVVLESIHLGLENHYKWYVQLWWIMLILVSYGALGCLLWLIHTKNLGDMWENHVGTLLQWRIGLSWCIAVMKNLCLVKVLGMGNYWFWKIIWNSVQLWVSFMFCLIYILNCDMQMSGHCSIHVCLD
jgi:hypothetical protein